MRRSSGMRRRHWPAGKSGNVERDTVEDEEFFFQRTSLKPLFGGLGVLKDKETDQYYRCKLRVEIKFKYSVKP